MRRRDFLRLGAGAPFATAPSKKWKPPPKDFDLGDKARITCWRKDLDTDLKRLQAPFPNPSQEERAKAIDILLSLRPKKDLTGRSGKVVSASYSWLRSRNEGPYMLLHDVDLFVPGVGTLIMWPEELENIGKWGEEEKQ